MRDIHEIRGLDPTEETQVQGTGMGWLTATLGRPMSKKIEQTGIAMKEQGTAAGLIPYWVQTTRTPRWMARSEEIWKPSVFICYSKSNVSQRKRLESELKILKNEGLLVGHRWHDRDDRPRRQMGRQPYKANLAEADVVIILASVAALSTNYITEHEIPKALEFQNEGTTVVVPIILEQCRWEKTALGALNALPEKAKPLNNWKPQADGWKTIADGLSRVFQKLMENGGKQTKRPPTKPSKKPGP